MEFSVFFGCRGRGNSPQAQRKRVKHLTAKYAKYANQKQAEREGPSFQPRREQNAEMLKGSKCGGIHHRGTEAQRKTRIA
jgi:hypothetical protein